MGATIFWLAAILVFGLVEAVTVGLASIWFAIGAVAAFALSFAVENIWIQAGVFAVVSVLSMALIRPLAKKYFTPKLVPTNADRVIGQEGVVVQEIDNLQAKGLISVAGTQWTARNEENKPLAVGTEVTVLRIEGVKVIVRQVRPAHEKEETNV